MSAIFISYRRGDSELHAAALYRALTQFVARDAVFRDRDSILAAEHWNQRIVEAVSSAGVVLALIGPRWVDEFSERPADSDYLVKELETALGRQVPVVPVQTYRGPLPALGGVPASLAPIFDRQVFELLEAEGDSHLARVRSLLTDHLYHLGDIRAHMVSMVASLLEAGSFASATAILDRLPGDAAIDGQLSLLRVRALLAGRPVDALKAAQLPVVVEHLQRALAGDPGNAAAIALAVMIEQAHYRFHGVVGPFRTLLGRESRSTPAGPMPGSGR